MQSTNTLKSLLRNHADDLLNNHQPPPIVSASLMLEALEVINRLESRIFRESRAASHDIFPAGSAAGDRSFNSGLMAAAALCRKVQNGKNTSEAEAVGALMCASEILAKCRKHAL